jgi:hypothetical protein
LQELVKRDAEARVTLDFSSVTSREERNESAETWARMISRIACSQKEVPPVVGLNRRVERDLLHALDRRVRAEAAVNLFHQENTVITTALVLSMRRRCNPGQNDQDVLDPEQGLQTIQWLHILQRIAVFLTSVFLHHKTIATRGSSWFESTKKLCSTLRKIAHE